MKHSVVTRIAPSPTGEMHIGTVRTALLNFLYAKQHGGTYFVRVEDTDRERYKPEWVDAIWRDFEWVGLEPNKKYVQSEHLARHQELLQKLISEDKAYVSREAKKDDPSQTVEVVRLRNKGGSLTFTDLIHGDVTFDTTELGDFVLARNINDPLYHFAVVVDDGDAGVTHVLRGDDHISNTPRQILIQQALGLPRPVYAHFPMILAPDRAKLSKRKHGATLENYRRQGFLPEAIINYLSLLGWNPGTPQELFTREELLQAFSIERMQKGGAVFDMQKMRWFNHEYMKKLSDDEFLTKLSQFMNVGPLPKYVPAILTLLRERSQTFGDALQAIESGEFSFMEDEVMYPAELLTQGAKVDTSTARTNLEKVLQLVKDLHDEEFTAERVKEIIFPYATEQGRAGVLWPMRVALSGKEKSPDPFALSALQGKEKTVERIEKAIKML